VNSIPLYHISPLGRAAIDAESERIRRELADRRAERESRQQHPQGRANTGRSASPFEAAGEVMDPLMHDSAVRP